MICQTIIHDFEIARRMVYVLDDNDFKAQQACWNDTDRLLLAHQHHDLFAGRTRWCDLGIEHFHIMIVNMLKIMSKMDDSIRADKQSAPVLRLTFFLCAFISLLQKTSGSNIELLRVSRVSDDDVLYDYSATLTVKIAPVPKAGLKVVINNGED